MFSGRIGVDPMDDSLPEEAMEYERPLAALLITVAAPDDVLVQVATALQQLSSCGVPVEIHLS